MMLLHSQTYLCTNDKNRLQSWTTVITGRRRLNTTSCVRGQGLRRWQSTPHHANSQAGSGVNPTAADVRYRGGKREGVWLWPFQDPPSEMTAPPTPREMFSDFFQAYKWKLMWELKKLFGRETEFRHFGRRLDCYCSDRINKCWTEFCLLFSCFIKPLSSCWSWQNHSNKKVCKLSCTKNTNVKNNSTFVYIEERRRQHNSFLLSIYLLWIFIQKEFLRRKWCHKHEVVSINFTFNTVNLTLPPPLDL